MTQERPRFWAELNSLAIVTFCRQRGREGGWKEVVTSLTLLHQLSCGHISLLNWTFKAGHKEERAGWLDVATDGNWSATKKFTTIVKGAERKGKKKGPTLEQSSALPNEVLKDCFGTTSKIIGSYPVSSCKSWIQVGKLVRFLDPCFLPGPAWKQFNPVEISGWRITWTFCAHPPWSLNAQLTQKIRVVNSVNNKNICNFFANSFLTMMWMFSSCYHQIAFGEVKSFSAVCMHDFKREERVLCRICNFLTTNSLTFDAFWSRVRRGRNWIG